MKNKKAKCIYLSDKAIKKLELLKNINNIDHSKIIDILILKTKKLELF